MYFDNNATTAIDPVVLASMNEESLKGPSNPSSVHSYGQGARGRLASARQRIAAHFGVKPQEVVFTSGGSEALNHALFALGKGRRILSSSLEHAALYEPLKRNPLVRFIDGPVTLDKIDLTEIDLIALMAANNETGTLTPINEIADLAAHHQIPFIVDGVALAAKQKMALHPGITAFAFSAHKFHGPQGVGALIVRGPLAPLLLGGPQEHERRAGTENLPGIIGMAAALDRQNYYDLSPLRDYFEELLAAVAKPNGLGPRVGNTSNLYFEGVDGESLMFYLDRAGLACSHGSACSAGTLTISRVLLNLGYSRAHAKSSLRFSFSRFNTKEEIEEGARLIKEAVKKLRR